MADARADRRSTRRAAIASASAATPLAFAPGAFAADPDAAPVSALAAYQAEVVAGYDALIAKTQGAERRSLQALRGRAARASAALPKPPPLPPPAPDYTLQTLIGAEEALVAGYYTALQSLTEERHLKGAAAFMADAGRRLVVLRKLARDPLLPRAFETGGA